MKFFFEASIRSHGFKSPQECFMVCGNQAFTLGFPTLGEGKRTS